MSLAPASPAIIACRRWQQTQGLADPRAAALVSLLRALGAPRHETYREVFTSFLLPRALQRVQRLAAELAKARRAAAAGGRHQQQLLLQQQQAAAAAAAAEPATGKRRVSVDSGAAAAAAGGTASGAAAAAAAAVAVAAAATAVDCVSAEASAAAARAAAIEGVLIRAVRSLTPTFQVRPLQPLLAALLHALLPLPPEPQVLRLLLSGSPAAADFLKVSRHPNSSNSSNTRGLAAVSVSAIPPICCCC